ncbi:MAG: adenosylmethionine--8-amino-7-oxononanoate transaminase [bacterium]
MNESVSHETLCQWDQRYVWHPFTQMKQYTEIEPLIVERAEGALLFDTHGKSYIDGVSSLWVNVHGHRQREIDNAIRAQLAKVAHSTLLGIANIPSILLAKRLVEISPPGLEHVFYSDDGSTAVEVALKIAFQYWQQINPPEPDRRIFMSFSSAYHGDTVGSVSVGGINLFHATYRPLLFKTLRAPYPYCYRCHLGKEYPSCEVACLDEIEEVFNKHGKSIAGVIIEPLVQGAAGMITAPKGFLQHVREFCDRSGALLIADEVATGFGKTGTMFACEQEDVSPDILVLAKGLTGGYLPLAATLTTDAVYRAFWGEYCEQKTFFHGHSYTGNPLGCAAALACLEVFKKENTLDTLGSIIAYFTTRMEQIKKLSHVGDVRQCGIMVGIELVRDKETKEAYDWEESVGVSVSMETRRHGIVIRPLGNVIVLVPPLCITEEQIDRLVDGTAESISAVCGE